MIASAGIRAADKTATVAVGVNIAARTSLHVSTDVLQFVVPAGETKATASVEFTAAARVARDGDVTVSVAQASAIDGPPGTATDTAVISFNGDGYATGSGTLTSSTSVAAAWHSSGRHTGRLIFTLRASTPGTYTVPVQFSIATR